MPTGRRERKKAATREAISDVATQLFMERGFDRVTVAEVAEAADVSIKTVFNHFGSKEDLFLDREAEVRQGIVDAVAARPPGQSVTGALRVLLGEGGLPGDADWSALGDPGRYRILQRFFTTWKDSTSLQGRHLLWNERLQEELCLTLAAELRRPESDDRVQTMGAMLVAAIHLRHRTFTAAVLAGVPADEVEDRVREITAEALGRVGAAFPELAAGRGALPSGGP